MRTLFLDAAIILWNSFFLDFGGFDMYIIHDILGKVLQLQRWDIKNSSKR